MGHRVNAACKVWAAAETPEQQIHRRLQQKRWCVDADQRGEDDRALLKTKTGKHCS